MMEISFKENVIGSAQNQNLNDTMVSIDIKNFEIYRLYCTLQNNLIVHVNFKCKKEFWDLDTEISFCCDYPTDRGCPTHNLLQIWRLIPHTHTLQEVWRAGSIKWHWPNQNSIKYINQSGVTQVN